jgi:hypothetical protein
VDCLRIAAIGAGVRYEALIVEALPFLRALNPAPSESARSFVGIPKARIADFTAKWVEPKRVCEDLFCILVQKRS